MNCCSGINNGIYDGDLREPSDLPSRQYLQVNSCGFQDVKSCYTTLRQNGRHDYHILLILQGKCEAEYEGKKYELQRGNFILYPPKVKHLYAFSMGCQSLWLHFTGNVVEDILAECALGYGVFFSSFDQRVTECFHHVINRFHQNGDDYLTKLYLMELLYRLSPTSDSEKNNRDERISTVLNFIHTNYANPITVEALAKITGYSKSHFNLIFRQNVGCTPIQYLNDIRLSFALDLLSTTTLSVGEIAMSCGFNDALYFSRAFHKKYHSSPSEYRSSSKPKSDHQIKNKNFEI